MKGGIRFVTYTAVLFALTLVVQMLGFPQMITGPLVNAHLFLATIFVGIASGILIGLFTPWIALLRGILPAPLGPVVPFIMLGNAALVIVFGLFRRKGGFFLEVIGIVLGASVKYLILSRGIQFLGGLPPRIAQMMQTPQLITALLGGAIALTLAQALRWMRFGG